MHFHLCLTFFPSISDTRSCTAELVCKLFTVLKCLFIYYLLIICIFVFSSVLYLFLMLFFCTLFSSGVVFVCVCLVLTVFKHLTDDGHKEIVLKSFSANLFVTITCNLSVPLVSNTVTASIIFNAIAYCKVMKVKFHNLMYRVQTFNLLSCGINL